MGLKGTSIIVHVELKNVFKETRMLHVAASGRGCNMVQSVGRNIKIH